MIKIDVLADIDKAVKSIETFQKQTTSAVQKISSQGSSAFNTLGKTVVYFNQGLELASKGFRLLSGVFSEGIKAAIGQEEAINDLNAAMISTGTYSYKASKEMQSFSSEMQKVSVYGDEVVLKASALGVQLAKLSGQELKEATLAAMNLSSALGIDLESAMQKIAKSGIDGGTGLKRYGIEVEKGATSSITLSNAIAKVNEQFTGVAASKINTYKGAITQAENAWGDLLEIVGGWITNNPLVIKSINIISDGFVKMGSVLGSINGNVFNDLIANGIIKVIEGLKFLLDSVNPVVNAFSFLSSTAQLAFDVMKTGLQALLAGFTTLLTTIFDGYVKLFNLIPERFIPEGWAEQINSFNESMLLMAETNKEVLGQFSEETKTSFDSIGQSFQDTISEERLALIKDVLTQTQNEIKKASEQNYKTLSTNNKKTLLDEKQTLAEKKSELELFYEAWKQEITSFKKYEEMTNQERVQGTRDALGQISTLTAQSNSTLFAIGKAAAISTATVDGILAVQKTLSATPYPINIGLAALVGVATAANVSKIASQQPPKYELGGIVPGTSYSGDNVLASVNSGEMILNRGQQTKLFNQINNGSGSNLEAAIDRLGARIANIEITLRADDIEIARSVSRAIESGFVLTRSA